MPVSQVPLYREAVADPYALNTGFRILFANDPEERLNPNAVTGHEYYLIEPVEYVRDNSWIMGLSADVPIASRFSVRVYHHQRLAVLKLLVSCGCACAGRQTCPISRSNLVPPGERPLPKRTCFSHMAAAKPCDLSLRHAFPATVLDILKKRIVTCIAISDAWRNLF